MTAPAGKSMIEHTPLVSVQCFNFISCIHSGSGEIVHPVMIDGNRKGADGGVYSTRLSYTTIFPPRFITLLLLFPYYFHKGELYYTSIPYGVFGDDATTSLAIREYRHG